jgi:hypothetical protein
VKLGVPSWRMRRRAVFGSLMFGMAIVAYVTVRGVDSGLNETLALGGFGLIGAVVAAYIGGAAYEDVRLHAPKRSNRYDEGDPYMEEDEDVH